MPAVPPVSMKRLTSAGTVSVHCQSHWSLQKSCGTPTMLPPTCSVRRSAMRCAVTHVPPDSIGYDIDFIAFLQRIKRRER
jgi:hypothetical protein